MAKKRATLRLKVTKKIFAISFVPLWQGVGL
jgi:hypothetical protein